MKKVLRAVGAKQSGGMALMHRRLFHTYGMKDFLIFSTNI